MDLDEIKPGQVWIMNRPQREDNPYLLHVLGIQVDKLGKYKIAVQMQYPKKNMIRPHYATAKLVSPQYFYGLTVKLEEPCANIKSLKCRAKTGC